MASYPLNSTKKSHLNKTPALEDKETGGGKGFGTLRERVGLVKSEEAGGGFPAGPRGSGLGRGRREALGPKPLPRACDSQPKEEGTQRKATSDLHRPHSSRVL